MLYFYVPIGYSTVTIMYIHITLWDCLVEFSIGCLVYFCSVGVSENVYPSGAVNMHYLVWSVYVPGANIEFCSVGV